MSHVNPITMEMIKSRMIAISREMVATMVRTAGTPIYAEVKDFSCGLFDYRTHQVVYGGMAVTHNLAIQNLLQACIRVHGEDPGIYEGDVFMGNDPYQGGGVHAMELGLVSPIFVDGEIVAWSGSIAHQLDIGGMTPGGFCLQATDCFQEGIRFPPVKLCKKGELQRDIWDIHRNNVRLPDKISMELKGQIAANLVAKRRIMELVQTYGAETFKDACDALIDLSVRVTEERIRQIPEGIYEHRDFGEIEGIGDGLLPIRCNLTVADGKLVFDFTKECPGQVARFINCTKLVLRGLVCSFVMPLLCYDVPWNEGCTYPIEILATPGTVLDAQPPAPCSCPHIGFRAADAALGAFNKALINSPFADRVTACWEGTPSMVIGIAQDSSSRHPTIIPLLETLGGGGGAFRVKDGLDVGSMINIMDYATPDVEIQENAYPILYLTRRYVTDSGGAGRHRGGVGSLVAITPYGTDDIKFVMVQDRRCIPPHGAIGGYPGASHQFLIWRGMDRQKFLKEGLNYNLDKFPGSELAPAIGIVDLKHEDVFAFISNGGGGVGDPLSRNPDLVARDVLWGFVSAEKAKDTYGVALKVNSFEADHTQSELERRKIRAERVGRNGVLEPEEVNVQGDYVSWGGSERGDHFSCGRCQTDLTSLNGNWKSKVVCKEVGAYEMSRLFVGHDRVVFRQYFCPNCANLLDTEVTLGDLAPLWDFRPLEKRRTLEPGI